jgi:hypothetical protein
MIALHHFVLTFSYLQTSRLEGRGPGAFPSGRRDRTLVRRRGAPPAIFGILPFGSGEVRYHTEFDERYVYSAAAAGAGCLFCRPPVVCTTG